MYILIQAHIILNVTVIHFLLIEQIETLNINTNCITLKLNKRKLLPSGTGKHESMWTRLSNGDGENE